MVLVEEALEGLCDPLDSIELSGAVPENWDFLFYCGDRLGIREPDKVVENDSRASLLLLRQQTLSSSGHDWVDR
jgi:hypothetical protein